MAVSRRDIHMKVNYLDTLYQLVNIAGKVQTLMAVFHCKLWVLDECKCLLVATTF